MLTVEERQPLLVDDEEHPVLRGWGAIECSPCTQLVPMPQVIWDVNGYYRELGFSFPYRGITRKSLRLAYQERQGQDSVRLTFVFQQLLNPEVRRDYDCTSLGEPFFDLYLQDWFKRKAVEEAVRRVQKGRPTEAEEVLQEWGLHLESEDDELSEPPPTVDSWRWAYYQWRTRFDDLQRLAAWQALLISALSAVGVNRHFSVGFFGKHPHRWVPVEIDNRLVLLINENEEPSLELAVMAAITVAHEYRQSERHSS